MLADFFKLNRPFEKFDQDAFSVQLRTSRHICNVLYEPELLEKRKITGVKFENTSFSKTRIHAVTFAKCVFEDCLFIGTSFRSVEFHDCSFHNCNFYKSTFEAVYAKPGQFRNAITEGTYANIA